MSDRPDFGFNRKPRFSVNHLSSYMMATGAPQRGRVIRDAKFPKKQPRAAYTDARDSIRGFLPRGSRDLSYFDIELVRCESQLSREPEGWRRDEIKRTIGAIKAFRETYVECRAKAYTFTHGPTDLTMMVEGVRLNVRLDAGVMETTKEGTGLSGGCVLFIASTDDARRHIEDRRRIVANMVYWALQTSSENIEATPRLCLSMDIFGRAITKASKHVDRFREHVAGSCREAATMWDAIEPPPGYDGPDWR